MLKKHLNSNKIEANPDLKLDHDHIYCAISRQIMRHPVLINSDRYFELEWLVNHIEKNGLICPITRKKITSVKYDSALKEKLDASYSDTEERHENYDPYSLLRTLKTRIEPLYPASISAIKNGVIAAVSSYYALNLLNNNLINSSIACTFCGILATSLEFYTQYSTGRSTFCFFSEKVSHLVQNNLEAIRDDDVNHPQADELAYIMANTN